MSTVAKNLMVRVGANLSGLISGFKKGEYTINNFAEKSADKISSLSDKLSGMGDTYQKLKDAVADTDLAQPISKQFEAARKEYDKLQKTAHSLSARIETLESDPRVESFQTDALKTKLEQVELQIEKSVRAMEKLKDISSLGAELGLDDVSAKSIKSLEKDIQSVKNELQKAKEYATDFETVLGYVGERNDGIVSLTDQIRSLKEEQKALESMGFSWGFAKYEENAAQLRSLTAQLEEYKDSLNATPEEPIEDLALRLWEAVRATDGLGAKLRVAKDALKQMEARGLGAGDADWDAMYQSVHTLTNAVKEYERSLEGAVDNTWEVTNVSKRASSGTDGLARSLKRIGIVSVGIRLTKAVLGELRSVVSSYISENTALQTQVTALKSSMGQTLAPAINLVTNALSSMMPYVVGVSNAIGSLIANLFGSGWTTVSDGAAAAADSISGASSAQAEFNRQLAGFDEITKLNSDSSGGGGGGSSSSTIPIEGVTPTWLSSLSQQVQEAAANGDFCGIGAAIANAINSGVTGFDTTGGTLGTKLAEWINNSVGAANGFLQNLDYTELWTSLITGMRNFFGGLAEELDWADVFELAGSLLGAKGPGVAFNQMILDSFAEKKEEFKADFEACGGDIWTYISQGIVNKLTDIGTWIKDNILTPFWTGFSKTQNDGSDPVEIDMTANFTEWKDSLKEKSADFLAKFTDWKDNLKNKRADFLAKFTDWKDNLKNKRADFLAKFTDWKDNLKNKTSSFKANLTSWKDSLGDKTVTFLANMKKGWTGTLARLLGIEDVDAKLDLKVPKISIEWGEVSALGKTFRYPKGFDIKWNAAGAILNGAQIFGSVGNTLLGGGEAGREAVLPLDRNTWWMDKIADRVALKVVTSQSGSQDITINLVLDGKVITKTVVRNINSQARATGKNPLAAYL